MAIFASPETPTISPQLASQHSSESYDALLESNKRLRVIIDRLRMKYDEQIKFISIAAHELRSPIMPILGTLELLRDQFNEKERKEEINLNGSHFDTLIRNAQRLERIASNVLDVTRIEIHTLNLELEYFSLSQVVLNIIEDFKKQFSHKEKNYYIDIKLLLLLPPSTKKASLEDTTENKIKREYQYEKQHQEDIYLLADKIRITQVISHLIDNAVKSTIEYVSLGNLKETSSGHHATRPGILITIQRNEDNKEVVISVRDEGKGIHPDIFNKLFEKFATKSSLGTGLGLFISKSIVEAHGGKIWGANNTDGTGATFAFSLPIKEVDRSNILET